MSKHRGVKPQRRSHHENTINFEQAISDSSPRPHKHRPVNLVPRTKNQEKLVLALQDETQHIVMALGPAGTGKTFVAMLAAIKALKEGQIDKIILTRPAVGVDEETHGFLPGTLNEKMHPWLIPLLDVLHEFYSVREVERMMEEEIIEVAPLAFMRGRTLKNVFLVADEMQNSTPNSMKSLLTRIGEGSRFVITGDVSQTDRRGGNNGLVDLVSRLRVHPIPGFAVCEFTKTDIQRHCIIGPLLKMYGDE